MQQNDAKVDIVKPPSPKAVAEEVAAILRDRIVKGELAPLDRIVERRLSAELNVSRTPIREALKLLESDELITISLHRGAHVLEYLPQDAEALFDVIAVLEGFAARRLAEVITPQTLQRLEDLHGKMLECYRLEAATDYFDINTVIHDIIVDQCGNPVLTANHRRLIARARRGRYLAIVNPDRLAQAVAEHEAIMQAFRLGDPDAAAAVWETHLRHTGEAVADVLRAKQTTLKR
ncbi:MAG: DNA-binding GntR family transcriptional regulator [Paracoccaceae bacterium]|jgi:DNA-binding GntR family transcriptional regulator